MRFLVFLALFAVAFADEVQVVDQSSHPESFDGFEYVPYDGPEVNFVDSPLDIAAPEDAPVEAQYEADEGLELHYDAGFEQTFVDSPLDIAEPVDAPIPDEGIELNFVDSPLDIVAPEDAPVEVNEYEADEGLELDFAPEPITLGEAPEPAFEDAASEFESVVQVATPDIPAFPA